MNGSQLHEMNHTVMPGGVMSASVGDQRGVTKSLGWVTVVISRTHIMRSVVP
jgi:hypothetical protein